MSSEEHLQSLWKSAVEGEPGALEALLREVQPQLYRYSLSMCRHPEDAEDVMQDALLSVARSFRSYQGHAKLSTWMFKVVRSYCIKKRRTSKFLTGPPVSLDSADLSFDQERSGSTPDEDLEKRRMWKRISDSIQEIEESHRDVLVLRDIEGFSAKETAEIVGISVAAVKSRLHRARGELRERVAEVPYQRRTGCPDVRFVFSQFLEGDLSQSACETMQGHVDGCEICSVECDGLKHALGVCQAAPAEVPPAIQARVRRAMEAALSAS